MEHFKRFMVLKKKIMNQPTVRKLCLGRKEDKPDKVRILWI